MKLTAIAVPGQVADGSSGDEVVTALGGIRAIAAAQRSEGDLLALNLSANPNKGHIIATRNPSGKPCALLVKHKRLSNGRHTTEIVGAATKLFTFNHPADFIHVSQHPLVNGVLIANNSHIQEHTLLPPFFSKIHSIANMFKENPASGAVNDKSNKMQAQQTLNLVAHFDDENIPSQLQQTNLTYVPDQTLMLTLDKLFQTRPVWLRSAIDEHLPATFSSWKRKTAFSRTGYIFADGPWRGCMCKLGYDPRKDPNARIYQIIDFRDPYYRTISWKMDKQPTTNAKQNIDVSAANVDATYRQVAENIPNFNAEVHFLVPPSRPSQLYQLCDIFDAGIQRIISETAEASAILGKAECSKNTGWYSQATLSKIRDIMSVKSLRMRQNVKDATVTH